MAGIMTELCFICDDPDKPIDRTDPDTMYSLSGHPAHGECGRRRMAEGKVVRVGEMKEEPGG